MVGRGHVASAVARAYNGGLGQSPQWGQGAEPLVEAKAFEHLASNADDKFAIIVCILQIFCKSPLVEKKWVCSING